MPRTSDAHPNGVGDLGMNQAQDAADDMNAAGFLGVKVDPLPNDAYTVQGQIDHPEKTANPAIDDPGRVRLEE